MSYFPLKFSEEQKKGHHVRSCPIFQQESVKSKEKSSRPCTEQRRVLIMTQNIFTLIECIAPHSAP